MKTKDSDLIIITKTKNLITYIMTITEKSPVKFRYSFVTKIHNLLIEIIENIYISNDMPLGFEQRKQSQEFIKTKFKVLDYLCEVSYNHKCITFNQ